MRNLIITTAIMLGVTLGITPAMAARHTGIPTAAVTDYSLVKERKVVQHRRATQHKKIFHPVRHLQHEDPPPKVVASLEQPPLPALQGIQPSGTKPEDRFSVMGDWAYSETPPPYNPADLIADALKDTPRGSPHDEIRLVAINLGLDVGLMNAIARIESDFNPHERTGSYIGLFQLSRHEFNRYGPSGGDILDARDNAIAAMMKIEFEEALFKQDTRIIPDDADLYLIHQQGLQGAAEHLEDPDRLAWRSMCATEEGREKGERWCKKAIWGNTLPFIKRIVGSVESFTSGAFVQMWASRVATFLGGTPAPVVTASLSKDEDQPHTRHHRHKVVDHNHHHRYAGKSVRRIAHHLHHLHHVAHA